MPHIPRGWTTFLRLSKHFNQDSWDGIDALLSQDDYYWRSPFIQHPQSLPGSPADVARSARDILTLWAGVIRDYTSRDYCELIHGYCRPRARAHIERVRACLMLNRREQFNAVELDQQYMEIEQNGVISGFPLLEGRLNLHRVIETVESVVALFQITQSRA